MASPSPRDAVELLTQLLDVDGVEAAPRLYQWGAGRPACILIPQWLAAEVWPDANGDDRG